MAEKKSIITSIIMTISFMGSAWATNDIVGTWIVYATAPALEMGRKQTQEIWEFTPDGTYRLTATDSRIDATFAMSTESKYLIEQNTIKIEKPGRPGKYYLYKVHEQKGNEMVLQGGLEGFYFMRKK